MNEDFETVVISKLHYEGLLGNASFLKALYDAGLENWTGYEEVVEKWVTRGEF